jgi:hypothetical protein
MLPARRERRARVLRTSQEARPSLTIKRSQVHIGRGVAIRSRITRDVLPGRM